MQDWYLGNGYTLMSAAMPEIGSRFEAARVVCDRGIGGVIERTRRIGVTAMRRAEHDFFDETNQVQVASSEIEAWKPLPAALPIWVIYNSPTDYPGQFVARKWLNNTPTGEILRDASLDGLRIRLPKGLSRLERYPKDEPQIVETWF
jgi:hypothetical protein